MSDGGPSLFGPDAAPLDPPSAGDSAADGGEAPSSHTKPSSRTTPLSRITPFSRITGWEIDGFGHFCEVAERDVPGGLVVFHGPNEAGKTTLLAFLRAVLFGFPHGNSREPAYEPTRGGRHGGRVSLTTEAEALVVERRRGRAGLVVTSASDGQALEGERLAELLGHADRELYRSVFAFGLDELQSFESLGRDGVADKIFSAGIRGAGRSARDALARLNKASQSLFRPRARTTAVHTLARELADVEAKLAERRERAGRYAEIVREEAEQAERLERLKSEAKDATTREHRAGELLSLWFDQWSPLCAVREQIAKLERIDVFPDRAIERLEVLEAKQVGLRSDLEEVEDEAVERQRTLAELRIDDALPELADDLSRLSEDRSLRAAQEREAVELERLRDEATRAAARAIVEELGPDWNEERVAAFDGSLARAGEARRLGDAQAAAEAQVERCATRDAELERRFEVERERRDELAIRRAELERETPAAEEIGAARAALARLRELTSERRELEREREVRGQRFASVDRDLRSRRTFWLSTLAIAVGAGGIAVAGRAPFLFQELGGADFVRGLALLLSATGLGGLFHWGGRVTGRLVAELRALADEAHSLADRIRGLASDEQACADALAPAGLGELAPSEGQLLAEAPVERLAAALDERVEARIRLDHLAEALATEEAALARTESDRARSADERRAAQTALDGATADWEGLRAELGLPAELGPDEVPIFLEAVRRVRDALRSRDAKAQRCRELASELAEWRGRVRGVLDRAGRECELAGDDAEANEGLRRSFDGLLEAVAADRGARAERASLEAQLRQLERRMERIRARSDEAAAELQALLVEGGARTTHELRARARCVEERDGLLAQEQKLAADLDRKLGHGQRGRERRSELETGQVDEWREAQMEAGEALEALEVTRDEAVRRHHELQQEREELERSTAVADLELERQALRQSLAEAIAEWQRLRVASALVGRTLERFERERQPGVLREASRLFETVTRGRYARIVQSSEHEGFDVLEPGGARKRPQELSRGTAEQLYLCVRLGLIAEFAGRSRSLPIVMDDVLVNFDDERADRAAELLAAFAAEPGRQLLFFTCSRATRDRLERVAPDCDLRELVPAPSF